jgi:DUF1365 family protein
MRVGSATAGSVRPPTSCARSSSCSTSTSTRCRSSSTPTASRRLADARSPSSAAATVAARTGERPPGPIRLLTNLRYLGHCFNPVSFYYCFDQAGARVQAIVAEVTNTPWGEHHAYVLSPTQRRPGSPIMRGRFAKEFHVSPFMGMDHTYVWRMTAPAERLIVHIDSEQGDRIVFDATLSLARRELTPARLRALLLRYPLLTLRIVRRIYANGLRLRLKGARYYPNPSGAPLLGARRARLHAAREGTVR